MKLTFHKDVYTKTALLKAAYHFTDEYYIRLDVIDDTYVVDIRTKGSASESQIQGEFENELLAQVTREEIISQTSNIRELILARAFASTIIEESNDVPPADDTTSDDNIFKDWFDENGSSAQ